MSVGATPTRACTTGGLEEERMEWLAVVGALALSTVLSLAAARAMLAASCVLMTRLPNRHDDAA